MSGTRRLAMWLIAMGCMMICAAAGYPSVAVTCGIVSLGVLALPYERKH